jgi:hypothetical protein
MPKTKNIFKAHLAPKGWKPQGPFDCPKTRGAATPAAMRAAGVAAIMGRRVLDTCQRMGTYGMGGPGFMGLELARGNDRKKEWLVLTLWAAESWVLIDDQSPNDGPQSPQVASLEGQVLEHAVVNDKWFNMAFSGGSVMEMPEDPDQRPRRDDGSPHRLARSESLLDAWVLSPSRWLYVSTSSAPSAGYCLPGLSPVSPAKREPAPESRP